MKWTILQYLYAIQWWQKDNLGAGHFNKELYEKFLEVRYKIKQQ